jgi:nitrite reductase/ring-hydroxylating ferredoxin subunit
MPEFHPVAARSAVPEGRGLTVFAAGRNVALFNMGGEIFALDGICPHKGAPLGEGFCEDGKVFCPMHGWSFEIKSGACLDRPDRPAQSFPVRIAGDMIEVAL